MGIVFDKVYTTGDELEFMSATLDFILGIDPRITCDTTVSAQYANRPSDYVPEFNFSIDGKATITLRRQATLAGAAIAFSFICGSSSVTNAYFSTWWNNGYVNQNMGREFNFAAIATDDVLFFTICGGSSDSYYNANLGVTTITSDSKHYLNVIANQAYTQSSMFNLANSSRPYAELETSTPGYFISRFSYKAPTGKLDYAEGAVCVNNGGKVFNLSSVYDCTEVTPGTNYEGLINGNNCFTIGQHQFIKL